MQAVEDRGGTTSPPGAPVQISTAPQQDPAAASQDGLPDWFRYLGLGVLSLLLVLFVGTIFLLNGRTQTDAGFTLVGNGSSAGGQEQQQPVAAADPSCVIGEYLKEGSTGADVTCLETKLLEAEMFDGQPDETFDTTTVAAVERFQVANNLDVDGVVGPVTGNKLGAWTGPNGTPPDESTCPETGKSAVIDRFNQRSWLCQDGSITKVLPMTSATDQPLPGEYEVYEKDLEASSNLTGKYSEMTHFVAFAKGIHAGARVAFHSVPTYDDGSPVQPLESVGTPEVFGDSSGCIRVLPEDAQQIWDWLDIGDKVIVVS